MSRPRTSPRASGAPSPWRRRDDVEGAMRRVLAAGLAPGADAERAARLRSAWRRALRRLRPLGSVSDGNRLRLYSKGDAAFEAMWAAIEAARESVLQSTYILEPDRVGLRTLELLTAAARRGCAVVLLFDSFGSFHLEDAVLEPLRAAGGEVIAYNPMWGSGLAQRSRLARNHQKILVVDGRLAFCGGMNVAEEYAGQRWGNALFRDTHLGLEGPSAIDLARRVEAVVCEMTQRGPWLPAPVAPLQGGALVQILESNVRRERRAIQRALRVTIGHAQERVWLTSPYFVPPPRLVRALVHAALRGIDVRVLTAGRTDVPIVRRASHHLYGALLERGVRIFEMQGRTLHAKTAAIDGVYGSVGSFNLDHWSDRRNLEVNVAVLDRELARALERDFEADLTLSEEVRLETWRRRGLVERLVGALAYGILRL